MFFISKLVLILLISETYAHITQDTEIILLPASYPIGAKKIPLTLKVFGQLIHLKLRRNDRIVSPVFGVWKYNAKSVTEKLLESNVSSHCHYYHKDHISSAAVNFCHGHGLEGLVFVENDALEIRPLRNKFTTLCFIDDFRGHTNLSFGKPHIIKKSLKYFADSNLYHMFKLKKRHTRNAQQNLTVELAIFFDEAAYNKSMFLMEHNEEMLHNMILAYVNRIQAAFNHPSLDVFINITLINFYILTTHKLLKVRVHGDVNERLNLFCKFVNYVNYPHDNDPRHWDISLLITGENLYEIIKDYSKDDGIERNYIMGKAFQDGACVPDLSCAIVQFCDPSKIEFLDVIYTIGYLLGLTQKQSSSDSEGYITWSEDSRNKMKNLWERKICLTDQAKTKNIDDDNTQKKLTIELAVFFDEAAYRMYMPILDNNEERLRNMILAYVNQIQAFFHHSSIGTPIDISLVQLVIMDEQPLNLPVFDGDGDIEKLTLSYCKYALINNSHYWDIGLFLTGINLYKIKDGQKNYNVFANSAFNTVCFGTYSCAIVQFDAISKNTEISAFSTSGYAATLIGHLLGIPVDSINSKCSEGKYIMTPISFSRGYATWSECSRNATKELWKTKPCLRDHTRQENLANALNHLRYHNLPGREWTAQAQCKLILRDKDANVVTLHDICQVLQCETPHKDRYFFAAPVLDGTYCALGKECRGGECVSVNEPPYILPYCTHDDWNEWKEDSCKSNCLNMSKGVIIKRRFCVRDYYETASYFGPHYDVDLCDDASLCTEKRKSNYEYASIKCKSFNSIMKITEEYFNILVDEPGWQAIHDVKKPWTACTIYCRGKENTSTNLPSYFWITPRLEMLNLGIDPYFPDGTWCHEKDGQNYYCRKHYCTPENYSNEDVRRIIESFSTYVDKELEESKIAKDA